MKKYLFSILFLTACSVNSPQSDTLLSPLPTTGLGSNVSPTYSIDQSELDDILSDIKNRQFVEDVEKYYGDSFIPMSNETLVEFGLLWCLALQDGMMASDVQARIDEGAVDQADADLHNSIVKSAVFNYCPEQEYKWNP